MSKNKTHFIIYILITIILIISIGIVSFNVVNKYVLDKEINKTLSKNVLKDKYTTSTKTLLSYSKVEKAIKNYMKDYSDNMKKVNDIINDKEIKNILSADNYLKDGPEFTNSLNLINSKKQDFNNLINTLLDMCTEQKILEYINKYNVSDKYIDIYKKYMYKDLKVQDALRIKKASILNFDREGKIILDTDIQIIDLLKNNKTSWKVQDKTIYFSSNSVMNQYNTLVERIKTATDLKILY